MASVDVTQLNILIVEDNVHFRTLITSILKALGVSQLEEARDGLEALELLNGEPSTPIDLVILDWKMDGMDGVECVEQIRQLDGTYASVPIIMVTGYTETSLQKQAKAAGVNGFLGKPVSPQSLLGRIVSVMEDVQVSA
ncbi:MAG: response regulator [Magnetovibrio sp.]|nr:response regulator [Magnetovibrio sp.]